MKVENKKIVVTGAGAGIGRELVQMLLKKGASVIAVDINEKNLQDLKKTYNKDQLLIAVLDVTDEMKVKEFRDFYIEKLKEIDILINNAGIIQPFVPVNDLEMDIINRVMNVNFYGPLYLTKAFLPELLKREEAHIVNVSSMGGFFPFPGQTIYGSSKAALKLFTEGLYAELLDTNVNVTIVFPGAIATDIMKNSNVEMKETSENNFKPLPVDRAATQIIKGIEQNKFQLYVGSDAKMMNFMYKFNAKKAIQFVKSKMSI